MTKPSIALLAAACTWVIPAVQAHAEPLIVVEDHGGASALPYYEALNLQLRASGSPRIELPEQPGRQVSEADLLPVHSQHLSPGTVPRRVIEAPGLRPFFLVGEDKLSHDWLTQRAAALQELNAVGLVVNVSSSQALAALRGLAPGLTLAPVSGDDLAQRLGLRHYPVLVTSTGIEQ